MGHLSIDQVRDLRRRYESGEKIKDLADRFACNRKTVSLTVQGKRHARVKELTALDAATVLESERNENPAELFEAVEKTSLRAATKFARDGQFRHVTEALTASEKAAEGRARVTPPKPEDHRLEIVITGARGCGDYNAQRLGMIVWKNAERIGIDRFDLLEQIRAAMTERPSWMPLPPIGLPPAPPAVSDDDFFESLKGPAPTPHADDEREEN